MQNEAIEAAGPGGSLLRVDFVWQGDRFGHHISAVNNGSIVIPLLASVEGTASDDWPPSPPLQTLRIETLPDGRRAALLVGMAGRSHWSASIETALATAEILLDLACRHSASPKFLGSRYHVPRGGEGRFAVLPDASRLTTVVGSHGIDLLLEAEMLPSPPATSRWRYRIRLTPGP